MTLDEMSMFDGAPFPKPKTETVKPKSNADRIRQMTDEELAEWFAPHMGCNICDKNDMYDCDLNECKKYALEYMKKEVSEDAGTD